MAELKVTKDFVHDLSTLTLTGGIDSPLPVNIVKTCDTFLGNSGTWVSKMIVKVMKKWGKKKGYDLSKLHIYSHAARFVWEGNMLWLFGSVDNGYQPQLFTEKYNWILSDFCIMRRNEELTDLETYQSVNYCLHLDSVSIMYQYWALLQWLGLVYLGINTFGNGNEKTTYCYRAERMCRKNLNPANYGDVSETDIFELLLDKDYHIVYQSQK